MKVKCIKIINSPTALEKMQNQWITLDKEYVVISIESFKGNGISIRIIDDESKPSLWDCGLFTTTDNSIPNNWVCNMREDGYMEFSPATWLKPGFWEDYLENSSEAIEIFKSEVAIMNVLKPAGGQTPK